ncbi:Hsp20/alpha crystallin family protein [Phenylobacterium sp. LjRoot225]|uniref:Hsp20/alpha crystallin family protein n=1 Tax=Phenylobacterium sp. LjRoot225 TaxID=3342285 RepID=UPI003ED0CA7B
MANRDLIPSRTSGLPTFGRDPFTAFRREMDQLFDTFFTPAEARSFASSDLTAAVRPSVDVQETEQAYTVTAELPGIDQKDIELNLSDNTLTLRGEKRTERNEEDGGRRYSERSFGRFERIIPFPAEVDADQVEASCENGVLKVVLPKNAKARDKTRRIEVRGAGASAEPGQIPASGAMSASQQTGAQQSGAQPTASPDAAGTRI